MEQKTNFSSELPHGEAPLPRFPTHPGASLYVPDAQPLKAAMQRTTHLAIGAHQDDIEIMAYHGIAACHDAPDPAFSAVVCTDGAGSPLAQPAAPADLRKVRREEQDAAARLGRYSAMLQLDYMSAEIRGAHRGLLEADLLHILRQCRPRVLYTHNPFDAHPTHIAVLQAVVKALRELPPAQRPETFYGCEVWRSLDWVPAQHLRVLTWPEPGHLWAQLLSCFASQIQGGKRYDLAAVGRARANATFRESHRIDRTRTAWLAVDLRPLITEPALSIEAYVEAVCDTFGGTLRAALRHETP